MNKYFPGEGSVPLVVYQIPRYTIKKGYVVIVLNLTYLNIYFDLYYMLYISKPNKFLYFYFFTL